MPKSDFNHTLAWVFYCRISWIFLEHLLLRTPLGGCFWNLTELFWSNCNFSFTSLSIMITCCALYFFYTQKIHLLLSFCCLPYYHSHFHGIIIHFIFMVVSQTSWCHKIIITIFWQIIHCHNNSKTF